MKNILVVTGSVRTENVNHKMVQLVENELSSKDGVEVSVADLSKLGLPFYNAPTPPSAEGFAATDERVKEWTGLVSAADGVIFVVPEYNHSLSAVQKNAIDWIFKEWTDKPVAFVAYGWYGGVHSLNQLKEIGTVIKWKPIDKVASFTFTKDIEVNGDSINPDQVKSEITELTKDLVDSL